MDEDDLSRPWVSKFSNRDVSGCGEVCKCFRTPSERSLTRSWTFTSLGLTLAFNLSEEETVSLDLQPAGVLHAQFTISQRSSPAPQSSSALASPYLPRHKSPDDTW